MNKSKYISTVIFALSSLSGYAQTAEPAAQNTGAFPVWASDPVIYLMTVVCILLLVSIFVLFRVNMALMHVISPEKKIEKKQSSDSKTSPKKASSLKRIYLRMVDSVPVEQEKDVLLDHDYDGIKELDNNLPPWWKWGFYFTILFSFIYLIYYHASGVGKLQHDEYAEEVRIAAEEKSARLLASADNVNEENVVALVDADGISKGKETFDKLCAACHRADGGGQVGPNLTDEFWLHGGGIQNVFKTVTYGVPSKGMISWQAQLSPKQIQQVSSYILTLKGSNPPGAKEPQGDPWKEEKTVQPDSAAKSDTVAGKEKVALAGVNDN